jgi:hypothetical protein
MYFNLNTFLYASPTKVWFIIRKLQYRIWHYTIRLGSVDSTVTIVRHYDPLHYFTLPHFLCQENRAVDQSNRNRNTPWIEESSILGCDAVSLGVCRRFG